MSKVCVSISEKNVDKCIEQLPRGSMMELRADLCGFSPEEVARVVSAHPDVLITWHTSAEVEATAAKAIEAALEAGAKWVDIEIHASESYRKQIIEKAHKVGAQVVISYHNYSHTPSLGELIATTEECFAKGADIAKIITTAECAADGRTTIALYDHFEGSKLLAFAMGVEGRFTRRLSMMLGAPWGYASPNNGASTAPGQLCHREMEKMVAQRTKLTLDSLGERVAVSCSKSVAQRAILCAMLAEGSSRIENVATRIEIDPRETDKADNNSSNKKVEYVACNDIIDALTVATKLGCTVEHDGEDIVIHSRGAKAVADRLRQTGHIDGLESGLTTRLTAAIVAALATEKVTISGVGTLAKRDLSECMAALRATGATVESNDGKHLPLTILGPIDEPAVEIDGSLSSQTASGLMVALPLLAADTTLTILHPTSRPYLSLTEQVMAAFGQSLVRTDTADTITYHTQKQQGYTATNIKLESDWSSAGYFAAAYAIAQSGVNGGKWKRDGYTLAGMKHHTSQADEVIVDILRGCGCRIEEEVDGSLCFLPSEGPLGAINTDATNFPDLIPTLAVVALFAKGTSRIAGLHRLGAKESNRAEALYCELKAIGGDVEIEQDSLLIKPAKLHAPKGNMPLCSYGDHRMVMALAVASLFVEEPLEIDSTESVNKSFPTFFQLIR